MATIGITTVGNLTKSIQAYTTGTAVTMPENGQLTTMHCYIYEPTGTAGVTCGIAANDGGGGAPGTLLEDTDEQIAPSTPGWVTFTLDSPLSLNNGDTVYLIVNGENVTGNVFYYAYPYGPYTNYRSAPGYIPGTVYVPSSTYDSNYEISIYATYTPTGGGSSIIPLLSNIYKQIRR